MKAKYTPKENSPQWLLVASKRSCMKICIGIIFNLGRKKHIISIKQKEEEEEKNNLTSNCVSIIIKTPNQQ